MLKKLLLLLCLCALLESCDRYLRLHYVLVNDSDSTLSVRYTYWTKERDTSEEQSVLVGSAEHRELVMREMYAPRIYDPEWSDTVTMIPVLTIRRPDGKVVSPNCRLNASWNFVETSASEGSKELHVSMQDIRN